MPPYGRPATPARVFACSFAWAQAAAVGGPIWNGVKWATELGLFVAVGGSGAQRVMTSPDGAAWTLRNAAAGNTWRALAWSPSLGLFAAVSNTGAGNRVMTSPDGINWTIRASAADIGWRSIVWAEGLGLFVAVATANSGNDVMTSPDGITWTLRANPAGVYPQIAWSEPLGILAACSNVTVGGVAGRFIMTSPDGINWTGRASPVTGVSMNAIAWSDELAIFSAMDSVLQASTSPDGIIWTAINRSPAGQTPIESVSLVGSGGSFVAAMSTGVGNRIQSSSDGRIYPSTPFTPDRAWQSIAWSPLLERAVMVSSDGFVALGTPP